MRLRTALFAASALLLVGAACSSDDGDEAATEDTASDDTASDDTTTDDTGGSEGGDAEEFCALLESDADVDPLTDEGQEMMAEIVANAPDELQEPIETLFGVFERLEGIDENDEEAFGEVFALMFDPEIIAATEEIEAWGVENCGLEEGFFTGEGDDLGGDDLDDSGDDDLGSVDSLQAWVDENDPDAEWADAVSTWASVNDGIFLNGELDVDLAMEACEAVFIWAEENDLDLEVTIGTFDNEDLVEGADGECQPA
jgi:hypothetical protein